MAKAYLYDVNQSYTWRLTQCNIHSYSMHMEICAGMIDMATTINNYYESRFENFFNDCQFERKILKLRKFLKISFISEVMMEKTV